MPPAISPLLRGVAVGIFVVNYLALLHWEGAWTAHRTGFEVRWYLLSMALLFMYWGFGGTRELSLTPGRYVVRGWFRVRSGPISQVADVEQPGRESYRLRLVDGSKLSFGGPRWGLPDAHVALDRARRLADEREADEVAPQTTWAVRSDIRVLLALCAVLLVVGAFGWVPVRWFSALAVGG